MGSEYLYQGVIQTSFTIAYLQVFKFNDDL